MARHRRLLAALLTLGLTAATLSAQSTAEASVRPVPEGKPVVGAPIPLTAQPEQLTAGPDGNIWVSLSGSTDDLAKVTQPLLLFRSVTDHVVEPSSSRRVLQGISSRDVTETLLENSYHVATLDNDAPRIFADTAAFVTRVSRDA